MPAVPCPSENSTTCRSPRHTTQPQPLFLTPILFSTPILSSSPIPPACHALVFQPLAARPCDAVVVAPWRSGPALSITSHARTVELLILTINPTGDTKPLGGSLERPWLECIIYPKVF